MINPDSEWCYPDSIIQPHALWHIICALATLSFSFLQNREKIIYQLNYDYEDFNFYTFNFF